jgi:hypothetical protein
VRKVLYECLRMPLYLHQREVPIGCAIECLHLKGGKGGKGGGASQEVCIRTSSPLSPHHSTVFPLPSSRHTSSLPHNFSHLLHSSSQPVLTAHCSLLTAHCSLLTAHCCTAHCCTAALLTCSISSFKSASIRESACSPAPSPSSPENEFEMRRLMVTLSLEFSLDDARGKCACECVGGWVGGGWGGVVWLWGYVVCSVRVRLDDDIRTRMLALTVTIRKHRTDLV